MNLDEPNADRSVIGTVLRRLGWDPLGLGTEPQRLADGQSGSMVWRIDLDDQVLVLKVTSATSNRDRLTRAEREAGFYRDLAHRIPLRVPTCLGQAIDEDGVALLLAAELSAPPLEVWTEREFQRVAHDLGKLHGAFRGETDMQHLPDWLPQPSSVSTEQAGVAELHWQALVVPRGFERQRAIMMRLASQVPALAHQFPSLPPTLCHGDAHRDNLLQTEAGEWIWADWQGVRLGQGIDDLTFFWQRAFAERESIPPPVHLIPAYRNGLAQSGTTSVTHEELAQTLLWSELRMWAIDWPPYLGWLAPDVVERVLQRGEGLISRLGIDPGA